MKNGTQGDSLGSKLKEKTDGEATAKELACTTPRELISSGRFDFSDLKGERTGIADDCNFYKSNKKFSDNDNVLQLCEEISVFKIVLYRGDDQGQAADQFERWKDAIERCLPEFKKSKIKGNRFAPDYSLIWRNDGIGIEIRLLKNVLAGNNFSSGVEITKVK